MIRILLSILLFTFLQLNVAAQSPGIYEGMPLDSTIFSFEVTDSLYYSQENLLIDTTGATLWKIGTTQKYFFSLGGNNTVTIMTDTSLPYPINSNDWFTLKILRNNNTNLIVTFDHLYYTNAGKDGGIVEFSYDENTWHNIMDSCNADGVWWGEAGILTSNFYQKTDTLFNGEMGFSGYSNGWQTSRFQFFDGVPVRTTASQYCLESDTISIRFRFISDSVVSNKDGWIIDNIKIENDLYWGSVGDIQTRQTLNVYPNPSDGIIHFPVLPNEKKLQLEIINSLGQAILASPYQQKIDLSNYPPGMYFYKVTGEEERYSGHLMLQ